MNIEDILSKEEIQKVQIMVRSNAMYTSIRNEFKRLSREEITVFRDFYLKVKEENYVTFGFKDEPYYTTEDIDELYPQYKWKDLSHAEKSWYNVRVRNKIK